MNRLFVLFTFVALVFSQTIQAQSELDWIYRKDTGNYYAITPLPFKTWDQLNDYAINLLVDFDPNLKVNLTAINNESENTWIVQNILPLLPENVSGVWIGLIKENNSYTWSNGENAEYLNFSSNYPQTQDQTRGAMLTTKTNNASDIGKWQTSNPENKSVAILETKSKILHRVNPSFYNQLELKKLIPSEVNNYKPASFIAYKGYVPQLGFEGSTDGEGMLIFLRPGEGVLLIYDEYIGISENSVLDMVASVRAPSEHVQMALVAFANPIDGSFGFINPTASEIPVNYWGQMRLIYKPPTKQIIPAIQFVISEEAEDDLYVIYVDNFAYEEYANINTTPVRALADTSFDTTQPSLFGLNPNEFVPLNETPGTLEVTNGYQSKGIRFKLTEDSLAANIAVFCEDVNMPSLLFSNLKVKREYAEEGLIISMLTDNEQSVGCVLNPQNLSYSSYQDIFFGGNFESNDKSLPPIAVFQYGGPNVLGSILIDNLEISKFVFTE